MVLKSYNKVGLNSLCKPLIGQAFHRAEHGSWSNFVTLTSYIIAIVVIVGVIPTPVLPSHFGGFLGDQILCHLFSCMHLLSCYLDMLHACVDLS